MQIFIYQLFSFSSYQNKVRVLVFVQRLLSFFYAFLLLYLLSFSFLANIACFFVTTLCLSVRRTGFGLSPK